MVFSEKMLKQVEKGIMTQECYDFLCVLKSNDCVNARRHVPPFPSDEFKSKTTDEWVQYLRANYKLDSQLKKERLDNYEAFKQKRRLR